LAAGFRFRAVVLRAAARPVDLRAVVRRAVLRAVLRADARAFLAPVFRALVRLVVLRAAAARLVVLPLRELPPRPVVRFFPLFLVAMMFCSSSARLPHSTVLPGAHAQESH
jgi:hypothetical protein